MEVIKRDGRREAFSREKIQKAIEKCLRANGFDCACAETLANAIYDECSILADQHVEEIQDLVEQELQPDHPRAAAAFHEYREKHKALRESTADRPAYDMQFVKAAQEYFPTEIQKLQFYDKYSRFDHALGRRETWPETIERVMHFLQETCDPQKKVADREWGELTDAMLKMEVMPSMRILQMAGPALDAHGHVGAYNCAYLPIDSPTAFVELFFILMQGTGVGYSVECRNTEKLGMVLPQYGHTYATHVVEDSTEGWCNALATGLETWFNGWDIDFDYSHIRPQGAPLKTKGGRASGPKPLQDLLEFVRRTILRAQGRRLTSLECHEIACYCGYVVQVGGVRRAALISLFDSWDRSMAACKVGDFWLEKPWLAMANNSAVYEAAPAVPEFMRQWANLVEGRTGEPGIFNVESINFLMQVRLRKRDTSYEYGTNPCAEIILRPRQFCNLSIAVARPGDNLTSLKRKVRIATLIGTLQSTLTDFKYLQEISGEWKKNCEEERLLGVDITGIQDCPLLQYAANGDLGNHRQLAFTVLREHAIETNKHYADLLGIPRSAAITCVKPSGNSSQLLNTASGLHPRFAKHYIRRFRIGAYTPIAALLKESGVPYQPEVGQKLEDASVLVFEFPVATPPGAITMDDMNAIDQLENWRDLKLYYTEHNPSTTIQVEDEEWLDVAAWVRRNWHYVGGLAFLPRDGGSYQLAPYEKIWKEKYEELMKNFPTVDYSKLIRYEREDQTTGAQEFACGPGGACEL